MFKTTHEQNHKLFILLVVIIPIKIEVAKESGLDKVIQITTILLGRTSSASGSAHKSTDTVHLQKFHLLLGRHILQHLWHQFCPHSILYSLQHFETIGDGRFAYLYHIAFLNHLRSLLLHTTHHDASVLTG